MWYTDGGFESGTIEAICANGSIIRGRDGEVLKSYIVDPAFLEELIPAFPGICFDCVTSDSILSSNTREVREAGFVTDSPWRRILMRGMRAKASFLAHHRYEVPLAEILQHDVCKVNCRVPDPGMERELHAFLAEHADTVVNAPFNPAMFEITDRACNKGESVAWLGLLTIWASLKMRWQSMETAATTSSCSIALSTLMPRAMVRMLPSVRLATSLVTARLMLCRAIWLPHFVTSTTVP